MDRKPELIEAARRALITLKIQNACVDDAIPHTATHDFDLNKWSVHFREDSAKYFRVVVDTRDVLERYGQINEDTLAERIVALLAERDPNDYLP